MVLTIQDTLLRLTLALLFGGLLGLERLRKRRPAGFRTYMIVCLGAALAMMLSQYEYAMLLTGWSGAAQAVGITTDVSRFGAQVINGIGFLGAGTIIHTGRQEVKGLTTAAGLWAAACMGLAIGAGFILCAAIGAVLIFVCMRLLPHWETWMMARSLRMNIAVEIVSVGDLGAVIGKIKEHGVRVYEVDLNRGSDVQGMYPCAIFALELSQPMPHADFITSLSLLECVESVDEIF